MEYEIYLLCNILGVILLAIIILFHFLETEDKNAVDYDIEDKKTVIQNNNANISNNITNEELEELYKTKEHKNK